ncbi:MAG: hypothetical protein LIO79_02925 [Rikenellaceae bacterium]|nr:hypothetical protein [Rikenellaceae bacterium]
MKLKTLACAICAAVTMFTAAVAQTADLQWIGEPPLVNTGVSWGMPFEKGEIKSDRQFFLVDARGSNIPVQSWVMARHGDGSAKWIGFAASVPAGHSSGLKLQVADNSANPSGINTSESASEIRIDNGVGEYIFAKTGNILLKSIKIGKTEVSKNGRLILILEDRSRGNSNIISYPEFESNIDKVTLEQNGPVRAVVKVEGRHKAVDGDREWLPFVVRFYIYHDLEQVKMVHTIIYDGDQEADFIKGLGVEFEIPLREEPHNRHVRFSGEGDGLWSEPVQPLFGRRQIQYPDRSRENVYNDQVEGKRIPDKEKFDERGQYLISHWAIWSDYRLTQLSPDGFTVRKRTNDQSSWIGTAGSNRASGLILAGDVSGGLAISLKNFWQSYPTELEVEGMGNDAAKMRVWMWSPRGEAMDLRHYDIIGHDLEAAYEDYQEGLATPYGVARTSELTLYPFDELPSKQQTADMAQEAQRSVQLMASPEYLHAVGAFGVWSLPDRSTEIKTWLEDQIDGYIEFYQGAIDEHKWYGFWNYGDVMHSYNTGRHMWNYDIGGNAWANTELSPDLWLWYSFIRTGRADIFKMAQAMTRHTSEVDMYHIGDMAGLGTRHNVSHWGCGAKEARIGQAWWKRFYYYLTTDERMGDIMHEAVDADYQMINWDPLRLARPREQYPSEQPARLRWGPDWIAFVGNWYTEWERTGNEKYLNKIKEGMSSLATLPNGLYTGRGPLGYDPQTGKIYYEGELDWIDNSNHLANLMGGFEVMMEVYDGVGHEEFNNIYLLYSKYYGLPQDDEIRKQPENLPYTNWWEHFITPRLGAFAARELNDPYLAKLAWNELLMNAVDREGDLRNLTQTQTIMTPDVLYPLEEGANIGTNGTAQWNLNAIIMLELIGDQIPSVEDLAKAAEEKRIRREQMWEMRGVPPVQGRNQ